MIPFHIFGTTFISEFHPLEIPMPVSFPSSVLIMFSLKKKKLIQFLMKNSNGVLQVVIVVSMNVLNESLSANDTTKPLCSNMCQ